MARAFVAIVPPVEVRAEIARVQDALRGSVPNLRWAAVEQLHITLAFLADADLDDVSSQLDAMQQASFIASLRGIGAFPRPRAARVLWLGVCSGRAEMVVLARELSDRLGSRPDDPFVPHLTVARSRTPFDASTVVRRDDGSASWTVTELVLFESTLGAVGATHRVHRRIALT